MTAMDRQKKGTMEGPTASVGGQTVPGLWRYAARLHEVDHRLLDGPGALAPQVRRTAAFGRDVPVDLLTYVEKVRNHAYRVTDGDVAALRDAGHTEDEIFEL